MGVGAVAMGTSAEGESDIPGAIAGFALYANGYVLASNSL